jgi:hypothetical protein
MLTAAEANKVWELMYGAEVRAMYFADLAVTYTGRKQLITGLSFFLSSGAAATVVARMPSWVPLVASTVAALCGAYSMAVGLDRKATAMANLQSQWSQIASDLEHLWHHWYEDDAEDRLSAILKRSREASQTGSTEAPNDEARMAKWHRRNAALHGVAIPA